MFIITIIIIIIIMIIIMIIILLILLCIIIFANCYQCRLFLGIELEEFMPSLESLFEAEQLKDAGLSENPQFRYLLKSGYEQINRVAAVVSIWVVPCLEAAFKHWTVK